MKRRDFLATTTFGSAGLFASRPQLVTADDKTVGMKLGLVTYNWGRDWDVPTLIRNCEKTGFRGVELRSTHKHGVEISLDPQRRREVAKRFADSDVELVGLGSACEYHSPDAAILKNNIDETKQFIKLCKDVGGSGVKVRPNAIPKNVPIEDTLNQIGLSLREVAKFGAEHGVEIRLEVHGVGGSAEIPNIRRMMEIADHPNAVVCWNCNSTDLAGAGLKQNFDSVKEKISTVHIHDLRTNNYPWEQIFALLKQTKFAGWALLEDGKVPDDIVAAMHENRKIWDAMVAS